jgi:hypothetical protein
MNEEIIITPEEVENKMKILVNLPQNRSLSEEDLRKKAEDTLRNRKEREADGTYIPGGTEIDVSDLFTDKEELKLAKGLLSKYLKEFSLETISDKALLKELIYLEVFQRVRLQRAAEDFQKKNNTVPLQILDSIHKNIDKIVYLKTSLGLLKDSTLKQNDSYQAFQTLIKKAEAWRKANQGSRTLVCIAEGGKVLLPNFLTKNIEDIQVGEEIVGVVPVKYCGLQLVKQKVLKVSFMGEKECLRLKTNRNRELICTPNHSIFSYCRSQKGKSAKQEYFPAENSLRRRIKTFDYISSLSNYYKGVLLGLIESDGWYYKPIDKLHPNWEFTTKYFICQSPKKELEAIEFILNYFNVKYSKKFDNGGLGDGAYTWSISCNFTDFIEEIKNSLYNNQDLMLGFLAGFILGDGGIDKLGNAYIYQKNKIKLLESVFKKLNLYLTISKNLLGTKMITYGLRKQIPILIPCSKKSLKFINSLFSKGQHFTEETIVSLELLPNKYRVWDLTTETQNFIVNGIIVHNCPFCGKMIMLKIRTDAWEAQKHPMFHDRILGNSHLIKLYKEGRLTKEDLASIFETSPDYVSWLISKWKIDDTKNI